MAVRRGQERLRLTREKGRIDLLGIDFDRPCKPFHHRIAGRMQRRIETALPSRQVQARKTRAISRWRNNCARLTRWAAVKRLNHESNASSLRGLIGNASVSGSRLGDHLAAIKLKPGASLLLRANLQIQHADDRRERQSYGPNAKAV
ncbi:hypothetical protein NVSP9465_04296 [Novosphingobium sp. CECT 9465]|nr:hypothetical protein NVSP9465_04296 [Novosphingobium sp. CECT 9465]